MTRLNYIFQLLKKFLRKLLQRGNEYTKNETSDEIKDYCDNEVFDMHDVISISRGTTKQDELYDDKFNNIISVETYTKLFNITLDEIKTANKKLEILKNEVSSIEEDSNCYVEYLEIINKFLNMENPTKEIMNKLIDMICVTKDKKLEIHYRIKKSEVLV